MSTVLRIFLASSIPFVVTACTDDDSGADTDAVDPLEALLDEAREGSAAYRTGGIEAAVAAGYVQAGECAESPAGAMGVHWMHPQKMSQPPDVSDPQLLLFLPDAQGDHELVGVEWFVPVIQDGEPYMGGEDAPPRAESVATPPEPLFPGHSFDGPMAGHEEGMPWHWDLHVWLYADNPAGMFEAFNPSRSCEATDTDAGE